MLRGEIRWYRFAGPDKTRPVLILTRDSILDLLGEVTIAPITSTIRDIPSEVLLTEEDGMPRPCAVNLDHVQTVPKAKLGALITSPLPERMQEVRTALLLALDFDR
jgi:mRNA interferase MazF